MDTFPVSVLDGDHVLSSCILPSSRKQAMTEPKMIRSVMVARARLMIAIMIVSCLGSDV